MTSKAEPNNIAPSDGLGDDLIWGVRAIAQELGVAPRRAFHLIEVGAIPAGKAGGLRVASRRKLRQAFEAITGEVA